MDYYIKYHMPDVKTGPTSGSKTEVAALSLVDVCIVILTVLGGGLGLATAVLFLESLLFKIVKLSDDKHLYHIRVK